MQLSHECVLFVLSLYKEEDGTTNGSRSGQEMVGEDEEYDKKGIHDVQRVTAGAACD